MSFKVLDSDYDVFQEIVHHPEFVPYMNIYISPGGKTRKGQTDAITLRENYITSLSKFYNGSLLFTKPERKIITQEFSLLTGNLLSLNISLFFVEQELFFYKTEQFKKSREFLQGIIDFIISIPLTRNDIFIDINKEKLYHDLLIDGPKVKSLKTFWSHNSEIICKFGNALSTYNEIRNDLIMKIKLISMNMNDDTLYFPMHPLQAIIESLIMSDILPYRNGILELIECFEVTSPSMFIDSLFAQAVEILKDLQFANQKNDMALVLSLYRYIFDHTYEKNIYINTELRHQRNCQKDVVSKLRTIKMEKLDLIQEYLPHFDENQPPLNLFQNDSYYSKAVEELEMVSFYNNPFDIIYAVANSISQIEMAATYYSGEKSTVFPFEVTFSLFMGVLLSSNIESWTDLVHFVVKYTPQTGLAPKFEYARANMEASLEQCEKLFKEEVANNFEIIQKPQIEAPLYVC